jgi:YD repeat-containing protein
MGKQGLAGVCSDARAFICTVFLLLSGLLGGPHAAEAAVPGSVTYYYDAVGRLKVVSLASGGTTTYTYDPAGNRTNVTVTAATSAPNAPAGLTGTAPTSGQVNLTWTAAVDPDSGTITSYAVSRGGVQIGTSAATSYSDTTTVGTTAYSYTVAAVDDAGHVSAPSAAFNITTPDTISPSTPTGLTGSAPSWTQVNLSWTASTDTGGSGLAGYRVYRGGLSIGTSTSASYSDTTTSGSVAYTYTVAAYDHAGNTSGQSTAFPITTPGPPPPSVPTGLTGSAPSSAHVNLSWTASTDTGGPGLAGYKIYRGGSLLGTSVSASYSDTTTSGTTAYSYTVAAYDTAGIISAQTTAFHITTPDTIVPSPPTGLSGSSPSSAQVNLTWSASTDTGGSGLAGYHIYRAGAAIATSATTSYSDTTVAASTSYTYTVAAYDGAANISSHSNSVTVTTPAPPTPGVPTALLPHGIVAGPWTVSWTPASGAAAAYYVLQKNDTGAVITTFFTVNAPTTFLAQSSTATGDLYKYSVKACNSVNSCSAYSTSTAVTYCKGVCP